MAYTTACPIGRVLLGCGACLRQTSFSSAPVFLSPCARTVTSGAELSSFPHISSQKPSTCTPVCKRARRSFAAAGSALPKPVFQPHRRSFGGRDPPCRNVTFREHAKFTLVSLDASHHSEIHYGRVVYFCWHSAVHLQSPEIGVTDITPLQGSVVFCLHFVVHFCLSVLSSSGNFSSPVFLLHPPHFFSFCICWSWATFALTDFSVPLSMSKVRGPLFSPVVTHSGVRS